ncbi:chromate transporter [Candidatus Uhrbacteria bacterium]|nr:chromate transporter [Candidatus Uhrbacteria bacterium]
MNLNFLNPLETKLAGLLAKAPHLPEKFRQGLVKAAPWLSVVGLLLVLPLLLATLGLSAYLSRALPFYGVSYYARTSILTMILAIALAVLYAMAIPGLFGRKRIGWQYLFLGSLVSALQNLLSGGIVGALVGLAIGLYLLFEVRQYYK